MTNITKAEGGDLFSSFLRRCESIKLAGGVPIRDVISGASVPRGWRLDEQTDYYIPPNLVLTDDVQ